jgi:hypothetical protein
MSYFGVHALDAYVGLAPTGEFVVSAAGPLSPEQSALIEELRDALVLRPVPPAPFDHRFVLWRESELGQFPPVEWFDGLTGVLPKHELVGLWGPGDSYKSFVALDWACHVASLGLPVLYIAAEGASGIQARIAAWKQHHEVAELLTLRIMPAPVRMHDPKDVEAFLDAVGAQLGAAAYGGLVVVDTLARNFVGGDENSAKDLGLFVEGAEKIRRACSCAVLVVHHSTKDGSSERGGESLRNASFAMYRFSRTGLHSAVVTCERMKEAEPPRPVKLKPTVVNIAETVGDVLTYGCASSLVAGWPYGENLAQTDDLFTTESDLARQAEIDRDIVAYLAHERELQRPNCSVRQVVKNVRGTDTLVAARVKALSLEDYSPVQVEKDTLADGSPGKGLRYFYELRTPPDPE